MRRKGFIVTETLKDLAIAAYQQSLEAERLRVETLKQQMIAEQAQSLKTRLGDALGLSVEPTGPTMEVDGMTFTILSDDANHTDDELHVIGVCPTCSRRTYNAFSSLVELGAVLTNPPRCSVCLAEDGIGTTIADITPPPI